MTQANEAVCIPETHLSIDQLWFSAPPQRVAKFYTTYSAVSVAVQTALRRLIPEFYFADLERYSDLKTAYPMLVYSATKPFRSQSRTDYTYDLLNDRAISAMYRATSSRLAPILAQVQDRLAKAGMRDVLASYDERKARHIVRYVQQLRICEGKLLGLLATDAGLVNDLMMFSGAAAFVPKKQARLLQDFEHSWLQRFRRIYGSRDFTPVANTILAEATATLASARRARVELTPYALQPAVPGASAQHPPSITC